MAEGKLVHIVDDEDSIRRSLDFLLRAAGFRTERWDAGDAFLNGADKAEPACVLLDVRMPGMDGLQVQAEMAARGYNLPVIVLTGHGDIATAVRAMRGGAIDFLEKPFREDRFLEVVRFALVCDEKSVRKSQELLRTQARLQSLSQRERQVLDGLVAGKANKMIAHELNISIRTVEIHRSNVMAKMEAKSLSELIRMALFLEVASGS